MIFKPTRSRRNVLLAVQTTKVAANQTGRRSREIRSVTRISALFADHERITEGLFKNADEAILLCRFWTAIRPNDRIFGADIVNGLELVRRRSWDLRVIPSEEIHLRQIYCHELWDTQRMWTRGEISRAEQLGRRVPGRAHTSRCDVSNVETAIQCRDKFLCAALRSGYR